MQEVLKGMLWTASLQETEELVRPEAMGAYGRYGIRAVLTVACDVRPKCVAVLPQLCLPVIENGPTPLNFFELACKFVKSMGPTLVHCHAGQNRSRVFAIAILVRLHQIPLERAIQMVQPFNAPQPMASMLEWARQR